LGSCWTNCYPQCFILDICLLAFWDLSPFILITGILLPLMIITFHFFAAFTDPGIIPRTRAADFEPENTKADQEAEICGVMVRLDYCTTCRLWRPPRTHHCRLCDACIQNFDHHCPWVGNCVGKRNYRFFNLFIWSVIITSAYVIAITVYEVTIAVQNSDQNFLIVAFSQTPAAASLAIYATVIIFTMMSLCIYHCQLLASGHTTYENIKKIKERPWYQGPFQYIYQTFCSPLDPSLISSEHVKFLANEGTPLIF